MDPLKTALVIATVLTLGAAVRLAVLGIHRQLAWLVAFLGFNAFQLSVPSLFPMTSRIYRDFYFFSEPVTWMLSVLMIQEMYHRVFQQYPAISKLGKLSTYGAAISAVAVCTFMLAMTPSHQLTPRVIQTYTVFWEMCVLFTLGIFILVMILIVGRFQMKLDPNLVKNIVILSTYFLGTAVILWLFQSDRGKSALYRAYAVLGLQAGCALLWGVLMRKPVPTSRLKPPLPDDAEAADLIQKLAHINNMLARSVRQ
jgi:hypothetical protein